mgnify:CR=1 FL=1
MINSDMALPAKPESSFDVANRMLGGGDATFEQITNACAALSQARETALNRFDSRAVLPEYPHSLEDWKRDSRDIADALLAGRLIHELRQLALTIG